jgi:hypothetical protein
MTILILEIKKNENKKYKFYIFCRTVYFLYAVTAVIITY